MVHVYCTLYNSTIKIILAPNLEGVISRSEGQHAHLWYPVEPHDSHLWYPVEPHDDQELEHDHQGLPVPPAQEGGGKALADFAICDWWRYCTALYDVKFCQLEGNGRNFRQRTVKEQRLRLNCSVVTVAAQYCSVVTVAAQYLSG